MVGNRNNNRSKQPDINLPFFAYGIFKPGQIAYSKIKELIDDKEKTSINYPMKHRDGVPILLGKENSGYKTIGYVFHFKDNEEAYKIIRQTISNKLYRWGKIKIGTENVNVLFGFKPCRGSNDIKNEFDRMNYDVNGRKDFSFCKCIICYCGLQLTDIVN